MSNLASSNPHQDIHKLFESFNKQFFYGCLVGVEVRWSLRMTRCAGLCVYRKSKNYCSVRLSAPLLKLRPHSDLVDTMLHEMIHAYLFVTQSDNRHDGHGPRFHEHMDRINKEAGTNITVYHMFLNEVKLYKQHWWRCNGICQNEPPYFGIVKRSMNRPPGPYDFLWERHQRYCGGNFTKIREPLEYTMKKTAKEGNQVAGSTTIKDITNICDKPLPTAVTDSTKDPTVTVPTGKYGLENIVGFVDLTNSIITGPSTSLKLNRNADILVEIDLTDEPPKKPEEINNRIDMICKCPVCNKNLNRIDMKEHLEGCEGLQGVFDDNEDDLADVFDDKEIIEENNKTQQLCAICALSVEGDMKNHLDYCLNNSGLVNIFDGPTSEIYEADSPSKLNITASEDSFEFNFSNNDNTKSHSTINKFSSLNTSSDSFQSVQSVSDQYAKLRQNIDFTEEPTKCPVCKKNFLNQVVMKDHLKVCKELQGIIDLTDVFDDKELEENNNNDLTKFNSPKNDNFFLNASTDSCPSVKSISEHHIYTAGPHNPRPPSTNPVEYCLNTSGVLDESVIEISDNDSPVALINSVKFPKPIVIPNKKNESELIMISDSDSVMMCDNVTKVPKPIMLRDESEARVVCHTCGMRFGVSKFNAHICY